MNQTDKIILTFVAICTVLIIMLAIYTVDTTKRVLETIIEPVVEIRMFNGTVVYIPKSVTQTCLKDGGFYLYTKPYD